MTTNGKKYCTQNKAFRNTHNSGFGNGVRKSQLYNARGKKLADTPVTTKLQSPSVSLSKIQSSPSGNSLFKDTGETGKPKKQCTSPNKLKSHNKEQAPPPPGPIISNMDVNPNISSNKIPQGHEKRPLEVPENITEPSSPTTSPIKSSTSFFQRFFQR